MSNFVQYYLFTQFIKRWKIEFGTFGKITAKVKGLTTKDMMKTIFPLNSAQHNNRMNNLYIVLVILILC